MAPETEAPSNPSELNYAREFGTYLVVVPAALAGFIALWVQALERGGWWWLGFAIGLLAGCWLGERLRLRTVYLIKKSQEIRNEK